MPIAKFLLSIISNLPIIETSMKDEGIQIENGPTPPVEQRALSTEKKDIGTQFTFEDNHSEKEDQSKLQVVSLNVYSIT